MKLVKHGAEPILGTQHDESVFDPHVQYLNGCYRMDFSYREGGCCMVAFSSDGITWNEPSLTLAANENSGWEQRVNRNCVIFADGLYRMWYTGQRDRQSRIGYAESTDGISFKRLPHPVLVAEEEYECCSVMNPCVIYENGKYRMWYSAGEYIEPNVICYAESYDGITWSRSEKNPIIEKNEGNTFECDRIGGCQVVPYKSEYLIFYIGYADINTACICLARSSDGVNGITRYEGNPILEPTVGGWDADSCYKPTAIIDPNNDEIKLWYNGRRGKHEQIGLATGNTAALTSLAERLEYYVSEFNKNDEDLYPTYVRNEDAAKWMKEEIPLLECPDKDIERTYYFRFWTYRKHIRKTDDGHIITEFLPEVPWSGKHNAIVAPIGHHLYEGRWLKNAGVYLGEYMKFMLKTSKTAYSYSNWLPYAVLKLSEITGEYHYYDNFLLDLCLYFEKWEKEHKLATGKCWSKDGYDAMEFSASGTDESGNSRKGIRPTLNSYMYAAAKAISFFARKKGDEGLSQAYKQKALEYKESINSFLWRDGFYRAIHFDDGEVAIYQRDHSPRELIGYVPWMFGIPEAGKESVFNLLQDPSAFYTEYGLTTLEKCCSRYLYEANHECLWNGYIWPFATSQVLTALYTVIHEYGKKEFSNNYPPIHPKGDALI